MGELHELQWVSQYGIEKGAAVRGFHSSSFSFTFWSTCFVSGPFFPLFAATMHRECQFFVRFVERFTSILYENAPRGTNSGISGSWGQNLCSLNLGIKAFLRGHMQSGGSSATDRGRRQKFQDSPAALLYELMPTISALSALCLASAITFVEELHVIFLSAVSSPLHDMHSRLHFLDLPSEILILILQIITVEDLRSCVQTNNRFLRGTICDSLILRYGAVKQVACVEDTPYSLEKYRLADRAVHIQHYQRAWLHFSCTLIRNITVTFESAEAYDFASDIYFLGGVPDPVTAMSTEIRYAALPAPEEPQDTDWTPIEIGKPVLDFATAIEEHNLLA